MKVIEIIKRSIKKTFESLIFRNKKLKDGNDNAK